MPDARPTRVLILGGGHAGVPVARRLLKRRRKHEQIEISLISIDNAEVWHGLLPQLLSGSVQPYNTLSSLREMLPNVNIFPYEIKSIDLEHRTVVTSSGDERDDVELHADYLVLALGSVTDFSRFPGLVEHGLQTKTVADIVHIRNRLINLLEHASVETDPLERQRMLTIVVAGAGFAGTEIASQANEFLHDALRFYPTIRREEIRMILIGRGGRIMPPLSENLSERALRYLIKSGIDIRLNSGVHSATATTAQLTNGEIIPTDTVIVTVGVAPHPLVTSLPVKFVDNRIKCDPFCRVEGWKGVYAAGDNAAIIDRQNGQPYPPTFLYAHTQGILIADNILADIRHLRPRPYQYRSIGELALLTKNYAVGNLRSIQLEGYPSLILGRAFYLAYTPTWRRRLTLMFEWLMASFFPPDITEVPTARTNGIVPMRFGAGEVIVREGEPGSRFYVISEGEVDVIRQMDDGSEELLNQLGQGNFFGELALLQKRNRSATVRARTPTRVLSIAREEFGFLLQHFPMLYTAVQQRANSSLLRLGEIHSPPREPDQRGTQDGPVSDSKP